MASQYKQQNQIAELTTKLGPDKLALSRFSGWEGMSALFEFRVEAISEDDGDIKFGPQLGQNATVKMRTQGHGDRFFTGICTQARRLGKSGEGWAYEMTLRPAFWLLSKRFNSRVFHETQADEVIRKVLKDHPILGEIDDRMGSTYPRLEYCVQHEESDLAFVLRLMEANGITYYFTHGDDKQTLVLNATSNYQPVVGASREFYEDKDEFHVRGDEHFSQWQPERAFTFSNVAVKDYDYTKWSDKLLAEKNYSPDFQPEIEAYHHPYHPYLDKNAVKEWGEAYAQVRLDAERLTDKRHLAVGYCATLSPGATVTLEKHPINEGQFLILRCMHAISDQYYRSAEEFSGPPYQGSYELMAAGRFVPPLVTPRPVISGPQTGIVVGINREGTEDKTDTDELGRVRVHLHWNRKNKGEEEGQTMMCRVAQVWASSRGRWGAIFIPRVGMEVLVEFIDGDPDRPIVTGCVYNQEGGGSGDRPTPYPLPGDSYKAGWKSEYENGRGYNEIVLIDKDDDHEKIHVHSEKDLLTEVKRDEVRKVGKNRTTTIGEIDKHDIGDELIVEAINRITFTVGTSKITMDPTSITIESTKILIKATAELTTQSSGVAQHTSSGPMTIKGGIVTIN